MLHVTNGDSAGDSISAAGLSGSVLPWRDILHEGPVPAVDDDELIEVRARFLSEHHSATYEDVRASLAERAVALSGALEGNEIVLWFEHDLYDQLQLLQILSWFADRPGSADRLSMICINSHPDLERFIGLGQLSPTQLAALFPRRQLVTPAQLELARLAWAAFRAPDPLAIQELIRGDTKALPFLAAALRRHLQQFPAVDTGLSRSESEILELVAAGVTRLDRVFQGTQDLEESPFLGDSTLWSYVRDLASGPNPLLRTSNAEPVGSPDDEAGRTQEVGLTEAGLQVLHRQADWIALRGGIDRWLGGTHLKGAQAAWRWDRDTDLLWYGGVRADAQL